MFILFLGGTDRAVLHLNCCFSETALLCPRLHLVTWTCLTSQNPLLLTEEPSLQKNWENFTTSASTLVIVARPDLRGLVQKSRRT